MWPLLNRANQQSRSTDVDTDCHASYPEAAALLLIGSTFIILANWYIMPELPDITACLSALQLQLRLRNLIPLLLLCFGVRMAPTQSPHPTPESSQEFIFTSAPFPSAHASTIIELRSGDLLAAWF